VLQRLYSRECCWCFCCQKFFRRGLVECTSYRCKNEGRCVVNPQTRNLCRFCRYQKCIAAGMSRNGNILSLNIWITQLNTGICFDSGDQLTMQETSKMSVYEDLHCKVTGLKLLYLKKNVSLMFNIVITSCSTRLRAKCIVAVTGKCRRARVLILVRYWLSL